MRRPFDRVSARVLQNFSTINDPCRCVGTAVWGEHTVMSRYVFGILMAALGVALSSTPAAAQFSSNVQGIVADQSGAVMPGVTVTARNLETQVAVTAVTNETGVYRLSSLAPGRYEL